MNYVKASLTLLFAVTCSGVLHPRDTDALPPRIGKMSRPFRLMSDAKDQRLRGQLPKVDDAAIQTILEDPSLILYTEAEIPTAFQDWSSGLQGIHSPSYNVSANNSEPYGNANVEFPWGSPGGAHRARNVSTFRFLWLPRDEQGKMRPIVWYRKFLRGSSSQGFAWKFPVGAVVGEVLRIRSPKGIDYTFEIRVRTRGNGEWSVDVFRPFPASEQLVAEIKQRRPDWQEKPQLTKLVNHLEQPVALKRGTLSDSSHSRRVFQQSMGIDTLPPVGDDALVAQLLTETVFKSALGSTWRTGSNGLHTVAPTTDAAFHITPARYDAGFIEVDRVSCMRCHETANQNVTEFNFGRDWYGRVRGSDGIFSIHPFDPSCISYSGSSGSARLNGTLIAGGVFAAFNPNEHSTKFYHQLDDTRE